MIKKKNNGFGKLLYILYPGEYYASNEDCILGTVTGSCVVICLYDTLRKIGGLRHFVVPGSIGTGGIFNGDIASQGIASMEYLFGEIVKLGGDRKYLKAKILGASYINDVHNKLYGISLSVMKFLHEYFTYEKIPVEQDDIGGDFRRKIYFHPRTGKVFRKKLKNNEESSEFIKMEKEYIDSVFNNKGKYGKVVIFD